QGAVLLPQFQGAGGVVDHRADLAAVADDAGVGEETFHVGLVEPGDPLEVEATERLPERLPLAEDREPRQPGLETLEAQLLEQAAVVGDGEPPLRVVVGAVYLGLGSPPAAMPPVGADHGRVHGASMPPDRRS